MMLKGLIGIAATLALGIATPALAGPVVYSASGHLNAANPYFANGHPGDGGTYPSFEDGRYRYDFYADVNMEYFFTYYIQTYHYHEYYPNGQLASGNNYLTYFERDSGPYVAGTHVTGTFAIPTDEDFTYFGNWCPLPSLGCPGTFVFEGHYDGGLGHGGGLERIYDDLGEYTFGSGTWHLTIMAVPEPSTWGLLIMGFGSVGAMLRHRRRWATV